MTAKVKKVLPSAIALWPKLCEVDVYRPVDKQGHPSGAEKRRYVVNLKFDDEDQLQVDTWLKECLADFGLKDGKLPWKRDNSGEVALFVSSGEDRRPRAVDADKNEVPSSVTVASGSTLKAYVTASPYACFGGGISLYISSYQILDLKEQVEDPFEREKGYKFNAGPVEHDGAPDR